MKLDAADGEADDVLEGEGMQRRMELGGVDASEEDFAFVRGAGGFPDAEGWGVGQVVVHETVGKAERVGTEADGVV